MRFGFLSEGDTPVGSTHYRRYHELVEQVQVAEEAGFDLFGTSEQHLAIGGASTSAPEVLYAYMIAKTSRIKFSFTIALMPSRINHPIRTAERIATLDILSHGRMEAAFGRGNTMLALRAFEVSPDQNKAEMDEGVDLILAAFRNDVFDFVGDYYKVPPRSLVPKPFTSPYPPLSIAATSVDSHRVAASKGLGVISFANFSGFDSLEKNLAIYDSESSTYRGVGPQRHNKGLLISGLICEETKAGAREKFLPLVDYVKLATNAYDRLANTSDDYAYTRAIKDHVDNHVDNPDYMINDSASFIVGDPEQCIEQIERYQAAGVDDLWMRVDSMPHEEILSTLKRFGDHVIPHFQRPGTFVRSATDVLEDIRQARPRHALELEAFEQAAAARAEELPTDQNPEAVEARAAH